MSPSGPRPLHGRVAELFFALAGSFYNFTVLFKVMFMAIDMRNEIKFISAVVNGFHAFVSFYTISKDYCTHIQKVRYDK